MRDLDAIVGIAPSVMIDAGQDGSLRSPVALQFVGNDSERLSPLASQQSAKESLGCILVASRLQQDLDDIAVLIHSTPEISLFAVNSHEEFVQMPDIAEPTLFLLKTFCIVGPELPAPPPDGFVGNKDAAFREKILHVSEAHAEAMIDPHGVTNDFRWKAVSVITGSGLLHGMSLSVSCPS